ncbi:hypothetical protein F2P56_033161 [Juglans regia]|uniref:Uncharacterized protein LOC109000564 n=2 Tax=Juglans regia TaxID=51240 RepID=A0A6P9E2C5_JUGRE|nr:uncharacterized protein LOC109000564 [Juglans regia]KAF5447622.1 hypothetical protein F2P56_033161 [Juglans regia]
MCLDRQESPSQMCREGTKNANRFTSSETLNSGSTAINGRPKAKEDSVQNYVDQGASGKRSCPACGRIFNSGKALGGHKARGKCFVNARKGFDLNSGGDHQRHICGVCGKDFPSVMSLSGHMRAHPERDWRGIQPPPLSQKVDDDHSSFALECIEDSDIDLLKFRPDPRSNTDHRRETMESSSCVLAAEGLVCLSLGSQLANKKAILESKKSGLSVSSLKRRIDSSLFKRRGLKRSLVKACKGGSILKARNKLTDDETGREDHEQEFMEEQSSQRKKSTDGFVPVKTQMMKKKKKKKGKNWKMMMGCSPDPEETLIMSKSTAAQMAADNGYICSNCGKSFVTFQALGGHRSIHTKDKKLRQSSDSSFADASVVENAKESNKTSSHHVSQPPDHDDGGHIRSCVWRVVESPGEASQSAPKIELPLKASQSSTSIRRILDFDLNEPYDHIMED